MRLAWLLAACCACWALAQEGDYSGEDLGDEDDYIPYNGQRYDSFDWKLCKALDEREPGNVIASPLSIKLLLSMVYQGSVGKTKDQLEKILQVPSDKNLAAAKAQAIIKSLTTPNEKYEVDLAAKIYIDQSKLDAKFWYKRRMEYYGAYIDQIDFSKTEKAANSINFWVETVTKGRIDDVISEPDILADTVMLLVNAVFFKGKWLHPFAPEKTFRDAFHSPQGPQDVDYMTHTDYYYYIKSQDLNAQILRLPYMGKKFAMYVVLPESKGGLDPLLNSINSAVLRRDLWQLEQVEVEVIMPKFTIDFTANLKELLRTVGITSIFENQRDLIGIIKKKSAKEAVVTNVIHKAKIEVNEEGSTAVASSTIQFGNKFIGNDIVFNASHPFLFFIEDEKTGTVVFIGKFVSPGPLDEFVPPVTLSNPTSPEYPDDEDITEESTTEDDTTEEQTTEDDTTESIEDGDFGDPEPLNPDELTEEQATQEELDWRIKSNIPTLPAEDRLGSRFDARPKATQRPRKPTRPSTTPRSQKTQSLKAKVPMSTAVPPLVRPSRQKPHKRDTFHHIGSHDLSRQFPERD